MLSVFDLSHGLDEDASFMVASSLISAGVAMGVLYHRRVRIGIRFHGLGSLVIISSISGVSRGNTV